MVRVSKSRNPSENRKNRQNLRHRRFQILISNSRKPAPPANFQNRPQRNFLSSSPRKAIVLRVPLGTNVRECIAAADLAVGGDYAVLVGGPMMGRVLTDPKAIDGTVVTKTTGNLAILPMDHYLVTRSVLSIENMKHQARSACVQCRMCTDMCPRHLIGHEVAPHQVMRNVWREETLPDEEYVRCFGSALNCCDCGLCEMFSCPMGLSPRRINGWFKQRFREKGLNKERNMEPLAQRFLDLRRVPTSRLYARLGLGDWHGVHVREPHRSLAPQCVYVPFRQHIGKPAAPIVHVGDRVERGALIASAQEGVSANVHTGLAGLVQSIDESGALIVAG
ncbi:Ion-translocating oxidoreductase complex subunit C [Fretibacterium fastidiosum]